MLKKIILIVALMCMIVLPIFGQTGTYTSHNLFYLPEYGAHGIEEYNTYNAYMEIADNQIWENKLAFGNYYLKTEIDTQGKMEAIWGVTLLNDITGESILDLTDTPADYLGSANKFVKVNATSDALEFANITESDISDLGAYIENIVEDPTPELGGALDHNNERDTEVRTVEFNGLYDNGNSGATPTIDWQNGNYQKIAISENALLSFSNVFVGTITLVINYSGDYTVGFNAGYTILEESGVEVSFTETNGAMDILKVMYLGTANNYVVGLMVDVKD